ncbi:MAG TPA: hypothetical protein VF515_04840 [Candidatus Binatia bacterium]
MTKRGLWFLVAFCILTGCTNLTSPARKHALSNNATSYWFDYAADRRGALLISSSTPPNFKLCAEPFPDVALKQTSEILAKIKTQQSAIEGEAQAKFASDVVELAGRTQTVLFLRESLYRLCEQAINGNLSAGDVKDLYKDVLQAALQLAMADSAKQADALAKTLIKVDPNTRAAIEGFLAPPAAPGEKETHE